MAHNLWVAWPAIGWLYLDVGLRVFEPCRSGSQSESELSKLSTSLSETSQQNGTNICVFPSICSSEKYVNKHGPCNIVYDGFLTNEWNKCFANWNRCIMYCIRKNIFKVCNQLIAITINPVNIDKCWFISRTHFRETAWQIRFREIFARNKNKTEIKNLNFLKTSGKNAPEIVVPFSRFFTHFVKVNLNHLIKTIPISTKTNSNWFLETNL